MYEIRLKGHLGVRWAARLDGMSLTHRPDGTTVIEGPVVDQAALHGLLGTLRDIGLPLLSVVEIPPVPEADPEPTGPAPNPRTQETTVPTNRFARNTALVAGAFYLITFLASIPAVLVFLGPVLDNPDYIVGSGADSRVLWGCLLDVVNALACIGTAVALYPLVRRQSEGLALGFVTSRVIEAAIILVGVVSLLAVVTLRQDYTASAAGTDTASLLTTGRALVAVRDWTFLLGPGLMPAVNALLLGTLMYRSRLVPRVIPVLGLIGAPLLLASAVATVFGLNEQVSSWSAIATLPVAAWELSVGTWMLVKGFRPSSPILAATGPAGAGRALTTVA